MMTAVETVSLVVLVVVGLALTYFGYEAARALLHYGGFAAGAAVGGWLGIAVVPQAADGVLSGGETLVVAAVLCVIGAALGRAYVPRLGRLAVGCLGFSLTSVAALVVFSEGQAMEVVTQTVPRSVQRRDPEFLLSRLGAVEFVGGVGPDLAFVGILAVGAVGGGLALRYKWTILSVGVTVLGALLLAVVVPLLLGGGAGSEELVDSFSPAWAGLFAVTGLVFEFVRYSEELELAELL